MMMEMDMRLEFLDLDISIHLKSSQQHVFVLLHMKYLGVHSCNNQDMIHQDHFDLHSVFMQDKIYKLDILIIYSMNLKR
jgi:hypothetical protein